MKFILPVFTLFIVSCASAGNGVIKKSTDKPVSEVVKKAKAIFKKKGITLFQVVEHHKGAKKVELELEETTLLIFGNPKLGTPLMQNNQDVALDLPQKLLVYRSKEKTYLLYNDPMYLKERHELDGLPQLDKISKALDGITNKLIE